MQSCTVDLEGPVHYADFGGQGPTFVLVHGLGGSHLNWMAVAPTLARRARVLALDLAGFGRTPLAGRSAGVHANRRLLDRFLDEVVGGPAILFGNSMGGTIAILEAVANPERVAGLVLISPSVPRPAGVRVDREVARAFAALMIPGLAPRLLRRHRRRLGPEGLVRQTLCLCCVDPDQVPQAAVRAWVDLTRERDRMPWGDIAYLEAARSLVGIQTVDRRRFFDRIRRASVPTLLVQGSADRLAGLAAAQHVAQMRRDWVLVVLEGIGHLPILEAPTRFLAAVEAWLDGPGRLAVEGAHSSLALEDEVVDQSDRSSGAGRTTSGGGERPLPKRRALPAC